MPAFDQNVQRFGDVDPLTAPTGAPGANLAEDEILELEERALSAQRSLDAMCGSEASGAHVAAVAEAIASQHPDGSWGSDDFPRLKACYTAQMAETILRLGRHQAPSGQQHVAVSNQQVQRALAWLRAEQHSDGSWGEDVWDTSQVLRVFDLCRVDGRDLNVRRALDYVRACLDSDCPDQSSYWFGPCFYGGAMEAFNRYKDVDYAKKALDKAMSYFDEATGSFRLAGAAGIQHAPAEWHTACVLSGLRSFGSVAPSRDRTFRAATWLANAQASDGSWGVGHSDVASYCTLQAIASLHRLSDGQYQAQTRAGAEWLFRRSASDESLTAKLMTASAVTRTHASELVVDVELWFATDLREVLGKYVVFASSLVTENQIMKAELAAAETQRQLMAETESTFSRNLEQTSASMSALEAELATLRERERAVQDRLNTYALKLTPNQLAVLGIVTALISFLIGVILPFVLLKWGK